MEVHHHPDLHHKKKKFKEYFVEFIMLFLAVTLGFFAESLRERLLNNEKEKTYMRSMIQDLKRDTAEADHVMDAQSLIAKKMDSALNIPVEKLKDIDLQDSFYHYFVFFYSWVSIFNRYDNTITQLKNAGGFSVIHNKMIIDSINELSLFYDGEVLLDRGYYASRWQRLMNLRCRSSLCQKLQAI